jgi:polysaccharide transporter, PST family
MIELIKSKIGNNKKLFENFISLYILQGTNYLLPLITFPYLSRVLGPENFGLISFANAFVAYFIALTDFGFNLSATRQVAIHKSDKSKVNEIFSSVLIIKLLLSVGCLGVLLLVTSYFDKFAVHRDLYYATFGMVVGSVLFPAWFFQGVEDMRYITVLNFILRLVSTVGIFAFVRKESDYIVVQILNSSGSILVGLIALVIIFTRYKVMFRWQGYQTLLFHLKDGLYIFFTSVLTTVYNQSNIFLLGIFTNNTIVGYFAIADKLRSVILTLIAPLTAALFPYFSKLYQESISTYLQKHAQLLKFFAGATCVLFITALLLDDELIRLMAGEEFMLAVPIFKILIFSILINGVGHLYTTLFLIVKGDNLKVFRYFSFSVLTYLVGALLLYVFESINQYSLSYLLIISELCVVIFAFFHFINWGKQKIVLNKIYT